MSPPVDFVELGEEFSDLVRRPTFDPLHDLAGAPSGLTPEVQVDVVWRYRKLVDLPPMELAAETNHSLDALGDGTGEYSLAVPRDKDEVVAQVVACLCRRLQPFHGFSLLALG